MKPSKKKPEKIDPTLASLQIVVATTAFRRPRSASTGASAGALPVVARVSAGAHVVDFAWPDGRRFRQRVELSKGQKLLVRGLRALTGAPA